MQESNCCLNDLRLDTGRCPCAICDKLIRSNGRKLKCSLYNLCYHLNCTCLTLADYKYFKSSTLGWTCQICCQSTFTFHSIDDKELVKLSYNSNLSWLCSKNSVNAILEDLPVLQTTPNIGNIPHLSNSDPESNTPSKVNFNYVDIHKFHNSPEISSCSNKAFSLLNCNIRSIQANFDNLIQLLNDLNYPFHIISLLEHGLIDPMNKSLILICLATHSSLSPLHRGQVELVCILIMVFNIVLDIILPYVTKF